MAERLQYRVYVDWDKDGFDDGYGVDVVTNGSFPSGTSGWSTSSDGMITTGWTPTGSILFLRLASGTTGKLYQNTATAIKAGQRFEVSFRAANVGTVPQTLTFRLRDASTLTGALSQAYVLPVDQGLETYRAEFVATHAFANLRVEVDINTVTAGFSVALDDVVVIPYALDDATAYVRAVNWSIGMRRGDRVATVGKCSIVLVNTDRRFSPDHAAGPHYGKLRPNVPVRVDVLDEGTPHTVFRGITESWSPSPLRHTDPTCTVKCADLMRQLRDANTLGIPLQVDRSPEHTLRLITSAAFDGGTASTTISQSSVPTNGQTIRLGQRTYRFVNTLAQAYDVKIAPDLITQADNLAHAVNAGPGAGTAYHASTLRNPDLYIDRGQRGRIHIPATLESSINRPEVGNNNLYWQAQRIVPPITGRIGKVRLWIAEIEAGAIGSTIICEVRNEVASKPGGVLHGSALATGTVGADYIDFNLFSSGTQGVPVWLVFRSTTPYRYFLYGAEGSFYPNGWWLASDDSGANWGAPQDYDIRMDVYFGTPLVVRALTEGAWGNSLVTTTTTTWNLGGGTLSGGSDAPAGLLDLDASGHTLDYVGGEWRSGETNALRAVDDVVNSVGGMFWAARDGTLTFRTLNWSLTRASETPALVVDSDETTMRVETALDDIVNVVTATVTDRRGITTGVVAEAPEVINVPGRWGSTPVERWGKDAPTDPGTVTLRLPYVNTATGKYIAALNVSHPVPVTDYSVNDQKDGTGFDYTTSGHITISVVPSGADMELTLNNAALGTLYVRNLQMRGRRFTDVTDMLVTFQDDASIAAYGRRSPRHMNLPFTVSQEFTRSFTRYTLSRHASATTSAQAVQFTNVLDAGGVFLYGLDIGAVVDLTDYQTGLENQRYMIVGIDGAVNVGGVCGMAFALERLDATTYWILGDATYSVLGTTSRLGV